MKDRGQVYSFYKPENCFRAYIAIVNWGDDLGKVIEIRCPHKDMANIVTEKLNLVTNVDLGISHWRFSCRCLKTDCEHIRK